MLVPSTAPVRDYTRWLQFSKANTPLGAAAELVWHSYTSPSACLHRSPPSVPADTQDTPLLETLPSLQTLALMPCPRLPLPLGHLGSQLATGRLCSYLSSCLATAESAPAGT